MEAPRPSQLRDHPEAGEAVYTRSVTGSVPDEYAALREGAALVDLPGNVLRLSGGKAVELLNSVLTNLVPEEGNLGVYALLLNPKGRIQTDLRILKATGGDILVAVEPEGATAAKELLGRYAPFYRAELQDLSHADDAPWGILGLYGPGARGVLDGPELAEHETAHVKAGGADLLAAGVAVPVGGYDLLGPADALEAAREHLVGRGAVLAGPGAYETARVEAGVPRFGTDITPENFPAEAGILDRAVSFEKGCYPGQETVARMRYRGHPNRTLHRFAVEGGPPTGGAEILQDGKRVGQLTSVAPLAVRGEVLALGYLSRNADAQGELRAGDATLRPSPSAQ
jgi:folate-binding protein YgfZ